MPKIETLTPEQVAYLPKFRGEYLRHGINCDPADRPRAERAFALAYRRIGKEPVPVIWVDSPLTAQLAFAALKNLKLADPKILADSLWTSLWTSPGANVADSLQASLRANVADKMCIRDSLLLVAERQSAQRPAGRDRRAEPRQAPHIQRTALGHPLGGKGGDNQGASPSRLDWQ